MKRALVKLLGAYNDWGWRVGDAIMRQVCRLVGHKPEALGIVCTRCCQIVREQPDVHPPPPPKYTLDPKHQKLVHGLQVRAMRTGRGRLNGWYQEVFDEWVALLNTLEPGDHVPKPPYIHPDCKLAGRAQQVYHRKIHTLHQELLTREVVRTELQMERDRRIAEGEDEGEFGF